VLLTKVPVLSRADAQNLREKFLSLPLEDGDSTAGSFVKSVKNNRQITGSSSEDAAKLLSNVAKKIFSTPSVKVLAYPKTLCRIMTNVHGEGEFYGKHVDNTFIGSAPNSSRADISFTLFLTDPNEYEGGALRVWTQAGEIDIRGEPGEILLYDSGYLHEVQPVTSGVRVGTVGWIQSWVRDSIYRQALTELDVTISKIKKESSDISRENLDSLHKTYNSFLRKGMGD